MKIKILKYRQILIFLFLLISPFISGQEYLLNGKLQLQSSYWKQIRYMIPAGNGNHILAGTFEKELNVNGQIIKTTGKRSVFLAALDSVNRINWIKDYECTGYMGVNAIQVDDAGTFIMLGWFYDSLKLGNQFLTSPGHKNIFVCRLDNSGNPLESRIILPDFDGDIQTSAILSDGNLILAGTFRKKLEIGITESESNGGTDIFVIYLNSQDQVLNFKTFGGPGNDYIQGLQISNKNLMLYGAFEKEMSVGRSLLKSAGKKDGFVVKMDSVLKFSGALSLGGRLNDEVKDVVSDHEGNYYITGSFRRSMKMDELTFSSNGETDIFLAKLNKDLKYVYKNCWGGKGHDRPNEVFVNRKQQIFLTGTFNKEIIFGQDTLNNKKRFTNGLLTMIDSDGTVNWVKQFSGRSEEIPQLIFADGDEGILVTGSFFNEMDFEQNKWTTKESSDAFVLKYLDPCSLLKFDLPEERAICNDKNIILSAGSGYSAYNWNNGYANTESVEISDTGLWIIEIMDHYGCVAKDTIHVSEDSLFLSYKVKDEVMPEGFNGSIELSYGGGKPPYNILWSDYEQTVKRENLTTGSYQVKITDANGCELNREIEVGQMVASGILDIKAFPNPIDDLTHIFYAIPENTRIQISLYDFAGRRLLILFSGKKRKGKYGFNWRAHLLKEGVYYLQIQTPKGVVSKKIIINSDH